ncbi:MAG: lamin tail domain-containing protein [Candidatus Woesebacteria bacterium]|nr:lamin tail domain-containing protein [Candidatus Woesebacteria bacterium]
MSIIKFTFFLISLLFLIFPQKVNAQILINEISPSTDPEWIELYNEDDVAIDLFGYLLEDGNSSQTDDLKLNGTIAAKGFLVFTHSKGWLNDGGDTLKLYNNASPSAIIDQYTYQSIDSTKSIARIPNGSENWQVTSNITNNSVNPNPTPSPTPPPTPTPQPTKTPTPTPKPTPTKTATSKPTITPTIKPKESDQPMNLISDIKINEETPLGMVAGASVEKKFPTVALIFIIFGIAFLGYGGFLLYNTKHDLQDKSNQTS